MEEDQYDADHVCASQRSHFEHKEEFLNLVAKLTVPEPNVKEATDAIAEISDIVRKLSPRNLGKISSYWLIYYNFMTIARLIPRTISFA